MHKTLALFNKIQYRARKYGCEPMDLPSGIRVIYLEAQNDISFYAARYLEHQKGVILVRCSAAVPDVTDLAQQIGPAILLSDLTFLSEAPRSNFLNLFRVEGLRVVLVLGSERQDRLALSFLRQGCCGILHLDDSAEIWQKAVSVVATGEFWVSRKLVSVLLRERIEIAADPVLPITPREWEILDLIGQGHDNRRIANELFISKDTVRWHLRSLYSKIGVSDRDAAVRFWRRNQRLWIEKVIDRQSSSADLITQSEGGFYRRLAENSLGLMCCHDLDGVLLWINEAAAQSLGYSPEDGVGICLDSFLVPEARPLFPSYLSRIRDKGVDSGVMRLMTRHGVQRIWMYRNVLSDAPELPPHVLGHALDITERFRAETELRELNAQLESRIAERTAELERSNRDLREFVHAASRDLQAPLSQAQIALRTIEVNARNAESLELLHRSLKDIERVSQLTHS